jgi:hypothetical protein
MKSLSLLLLLLATLAAQLFAPLAAQAATAPPAWKVAYLSGPLPVPEAKILLTVYSDHLSFEDKHHRPLLQITASQISDIVYSPVRFRRGGFSLSDYQYCGQGCAGIFFVNVAVLLLAAPFHGHSHYLTVNWTDNGVDQEILFEAGKNDLVALTHALRQFQGVRWLDVEAEGQKVKEEIAQNKEKAISISFDRVSKAGDFDLTAGQYQVLVLERGEGKADVYFFADRVEASKIKAVVRAELANSDAPTSVEYSSNTFQSVAIHLPGKTLRIDNGASSPALRRGASKKLVRNLTH